MIISIISTYAPTKIGFYAYRACLDVAILH